MAGNHPNMAGKNTLLHLFVSLFSLLGSMLGFSPTSKRLYLTFLILVFVFDCQLSSFLNIKTVHCLNLIFLIKIMFTVSIHLVGASLEVG